MNPKLGLVWRPTANTTIRAAAFKTLYNDLTTSRLNPQPRLEPVQVAGFTQLIFGGRGDEATVRGLAIEQELSPELFVGWQAESRHTGRTVTNLVDGRLEDTLHVELRERAQQAYLYWMPLEQISFSARYEHGRYSSEPVELLGYSQMTIDASAPRSALLLARWLDGRGTRLARASGGRRSKRLPPRHSSRTRLHPERIVFGS